MLHTPIPARVAEPETKSDMRLLAVAGILLAMGASVALWGAIYTSCILLA